MDACGEDNAAAGASAAERYLVVIGDVHARSKNILSVVHACLAWWPPIECPQQDERFFTIVLATWRRALSVRCSPYFNALTR